MSTINVIKCPSAKYMNSKNNDNKPNKKVHKNNRN